MKYAELVTGYKNKGYDLISYGTVKEDKKYNLYKLIINNNSKKTLLINTGFHGEEFNGPISTLKIIDEVNKYSKIKKVNLIIYICANPSGFENHHRYNMSHETQNNDFLRYLVNEKWIDILRKGVKFKKFKIIEAKAKETRLLKKDILKSNLIPAGCIDIHQDDEVRKGDFYIYIFDKRKEYEKIMKKADKIALRCRNIVSKNFDVNDVEFNDSIDSQGFIKIHDGTITDLFYRFGTKYSITIETSTNTKLNKVCNINRLFIKEIINLIADSKQTDKKL